MSRYANSTPQILDGNGNVIVGAKKFMFEVGTTTKKTVYTDSALTTAQTNPVISDSDGRFPDIFLNGLYKEEQQDNSGTATGYDGVTLWTRDPVGEVVEGPLLLWETDTTYDIPDITLGSNDEYYRSLTDSNTGNDPTSSPGSWEQLQFGRVWNANITYNVSDSVYGSDGFLYISITPGNLNNDPITSASSWRPATAQGQSTNASGTVDAITATFSPAIAGLNNALEVRIRAAGANATTTPTFSPNGLTAKTIVKNGNQALAVADIPRADYEMILKYNSSNDVWELLNPSKVAAVDLLAGAVVQVVNTSDGAVATGTTVVPSDDTIPQITEGDEYITLAITPKFDDSILYIDINANLASSSGLVVIGCLFKDAVANALSVVAIENVTANAHQLFNLSHSIVSGSTSAITFRFRAGASGAGTTTFNGRNSARKFGGVMLSSIRITEVRV